MFPAGEESPGSIGQDAGYRPVEVTPRKVQQKKNRQIGVIQFGKGGMVV